MAWQLDGGWPGWVDGCSRREFPRGWKAWVAGVAGGGGWLWRGVGSGLEVTDLVVVGLAGRITP